jgi:hypothetical protein
MTDQELMQMALDALEEAADYIGCPDDDDAIGVTRKALRARLAQPEREWQGLTDEEIESTWQRNLFETYIRKGDVQTLGRAIEAKLKEKNEKL